MKKSVILTLAVLTALVLWASTGLPASAPADWTGGPPSTRPNAAPVPINLSRNAGTSERPAVAIDPQGNIHVLWSDKTPGNYDIFYRRWNGTSWSQIENISQNKGNSFGAALAADPQGSVHAVWYDYTSGNNREILYRRWKDGAWSPTENISQTIDVSREPAIAADPWGNIHVVWADYTPGNFDILYRRWNGIAWSPTENISQNTGDSSFPAIATDSKGDIHVAWEDKTPGNSEILYRRWNGIAWSEAENLSQNSGDSFSPALAADHQGNVHVAWYDTTFGNSEILHRRWDGITWSPTTNLSRNNGDSLWPAAVADTLGNVYVLWQDNTSSVTWEVLYRRWNGTAWSRSSNLSQNNGDSSRPAAATDTLGNVHVVWQDHTSGTWEILYATIAPPPAPTPTPPPTAHQIYLSAGWNLISVPSAQQDPSIGAVFAQTPAVTRVYTLRNGTWESASRGTEGWSGNLTQIIDGRGYWAYATAPATLTLNPKPADPQAPRPSYPLTSGWNMIGYTSSLATMPVDTYLASIAAKWTSLYRYRATRGWELAKPGGLGFNTAERGRGYWIHLTSAGTLAP